MEIYCEHAHCCIVHIPFVHSLARLLSSFTSLASLAFSSGRFHFRFRLALCMNDFCEKWNVFVFRFCLYNMFVPVSSSSFHSASASLHLNPVKLLQEFSFLILNMNRKCLVHKHTFRAQFYFSGFSIRIGTVVAQAKLYSSCFEHRVQKHSFYMIK